MMIWDMLPVALRGMKCNAQQIPEIIDCLDSCGSAITVPPIQKH
jgi:hypothetical protein